MATGLMAGKRGLIMGLANDKSIAWGIAQACAAQGAELAFSYQGDALLKRVQPLAESIGSSTFVECDVADEASLDGLFAHLKEMWGQIDFVVHAIGFSDKAELRGRYVDTTRDNFLKTMDISVFSFTMVGSREVKSSLRVTVIPPNASFRFAMPSRFMETKYWMSTPSSKRLTASRVNAQLCLRPSPNP